MAKYGFALLVLLISIHGLGQTLGGNAYFSFVRNPQSAQVAALGGINISTFSNDISTAFGNPALLRKKYAGQVNASFFSFRNGVSQYGLTAGFQTKKPSTNIGLGVQYLDYGNLNQTDASGNVLGNFKPSDVALQLMFSQQYKSNWHFGMAVKWLNSNYGIARYNALAADAGLTYYDSTRLLQLAVVVKNIGGILKSQQERVNGELPFDLQLGITKRLAKAPIQFSLTAHHLHRFNIYYKDTIFLQEEGEDLFANKRNTVEKIFSHLVFSSQVFIQDKIEVSFGYNFLRRQSLNALNAANGLNGVTLGAGLLLKKMQLRYASGFYQQQNFHHFSINTSLY